MRADCWTAVNVSNLSTAKQAAAAGDLTARSWQKWIQSLHTPKCFFQNGNLHILNYSGGDPRVATSHIV